jgi:hypothetical protein
MHWLIFSYEHNTIIKQCDDLLQVSGQIVTHNHHHGNSSLQEIKEKINKYKPDRIIVITNEQDIQENNSPLAKTLTDQLLIPLYICQATTSPYNCIPVLLLTFTSEKNLSNSISPINIVQNATNELINIYSHIIKYINREKKSQLFFVFFFFSSARLFTPISDENLNEENLLKNFKSFWNNNPEEPHHITILSDVLPILIALIHDGKANGQINVCNKGTISLNWFEQYISKQTKKEIILPHLIEAENLTDEFERLNKQMISPETRHLYQASFVLPHVSKSIQQYLQQKSIHLHPDAPKILLVTGGCGFIGSTFINHWLDTYPNDRIINIDRLDSVSNTKNIQNSQSLNYSLIVADIGNKDIVLHLMKQYNITHIVHFAGKNQK